ncbi:Alpha/beta hydrolase family [Teratosphaeria destructans]|uniref:Alpha/beta hydrolase family n=1 Tax=Teratosphaeria destructans TaxID=418781 RepID=A0A9W7SI35_9PEZI|nr:Alpha/beta hydrolase family [Teratosphaeria destructans]
MSTSAFRIREHKVPTAHIREYARATAEDQEDVLHLAVKQYSPKEAFAASSEVTVVGAHANGFPKELYEPLWDELYSRLKAQGIRISNIFIADVAHQGWSGVLNERKLGNDPSWMDHPRDLFLMVNHFRSEMKRPLIAIGHSMGGNNLVNLSLMHPRLFTTMILIDPVIQRHISVTGNFGPAKASTNRRDRWPSRRAAEAAFKRSKFYQTWDPRVLDLWLEHGVREVPTSLYPEATAASATPPVITADLSTATVSPAPRTEKEVTLTTTKHQEVMTFLRPNLPTPGHPDPATSPNAFTHPDIDPSSGPLSPFYRPESVATFKKLPHLRPSVFYIFGDKSDLSAPVLVADKLANTGVGVGGSGGVKKGRVSSVTFEGVGHLIPMEVVGKTADAVAGWLTPEIARWQEWEKAERREWAAVPREKRNVLSEEYLRAINNDLPQKSKL